MRRKNESGRFDEVHTRTWNTVDSPDLFPEMTGPDPIVDKPVFGICFSGGGTRSATATLGQLRALKEFGWLDSAQYISANSGGTWTTVPYTYLPEEFDEDRFLGQYLPPEKINDETLVPAEDDRCSMASSIHHARLATLRDFFRVRVKDGDETYSNFVGKIFLKPFGLYDRKKFFTLDKNHRAQILNGNRSLREDDFYLVQKKRPFLIVVGTLLARQTGAPAKERYLFEVTPLYVGTRRLGMVNKGTSNDKFWIGGGYVEPFGYDSYAPQDPPVDGRWKVQLKGRLSRLEPTSNLRYRFTLSDAIGMSSSAPLVRLTKFRIPNAFFPEFRHWAAGRLTQEAPPNDINDDELQHGDGADIDNLAILPLLARKVENILVFINTRKRFKPRKKAPCESVGTETFVDDLVNLFCSTHFRVFKNGEEELRKICRAFRECRAAGRPLVYCQQYEVIENHHLSVRPYKPRICWVYLDRAQRWIDAIPDGGGNLTSKLKDGEGKFDRFPHYRTFAENDAIVDLDPERVHALASLTAWTLHESKSYIAEHLTGASLQLKV